MSKVGQTLLKGHTLSSEGGAYDDEGHVLPRHEKLGRAKCSCGWLSEPEISISARKRAHAAHKEELRG